MMRIIAFGRYSFDTKYKILIKRNGGVYMLEVKRKDGESFESLIRRFTRKTIQSGKILQAKKIRFFSKTDSKKKTRDTALRRRNITARFDYLKKVGKLDDFELRRKKRR
ncbi:MAG: 30S ribosomal protein S21 [Candidatus Komeilibacteria bacterium]|jgi:ribosomal protein S21|nr:30S ribosomal protein S21 [Candidatus Komeilibacteria bacterium]